VSGEPLYLPMHGSVEIANPARLSTREITENPKLRSPAFRVEEIFLPKSVLDKAEDACFQAILRNRDPARLDVYLDAEGLRDAWFVVRKQAIESDGSIWRTTEHNFECKRYHVHTACMKETENKRYNLEVFTRAISKANGRETDALPSAGQAKDPSMSIFRFDNARIIPIPECGIGLMPRAVYDRLAYDPSRIIGREPRWPAEEPPPTPPAYRRESQASPLYAGGIEGGS